MNRLLKAILGIGIAICVIGSIAMTIAFSFNDHEYIVTVTDKERIVKEDNSYHIVFTETEDGEVKVLKNTEIPL